jgi:glycosyltransferase involved in cell wall biosynthesis
MRDFKAVLSRPIQQTTVRFEHMKIALLSGASSIHTIRWANGLEGLGHEVHVITQHPVTDALSPRVKLHRFPFRGVLGYFTMALAVRKLLRHIKPDILNTHYASGYATTARLVGYHPWLLSVWGSDIYDFPHKSPLHKWFVTKNIKAADAVASTSHCMAEEARALVPSLRDIAITPFGVDISALAPIEPARLEQKDRLVIGTVKTMKPQYGVDTLIRAFALLVNRCAAAPELGVRELLLRLVGDGEQIHELRTLAQHLGVVSQVEFVGRVPHDQVPNELQKLDIYVALSRSESFGVAILEAGAAGRPVVVSDAGGLPEVTVEGVTGLVVPRDNPLAAAQALEMLILDPMLRHRMGVAAQRHVAQHYSWDASLQKMLDVYAQTIYQRDLG